MNKEKDMTNVTLYIDLKKAMDKTEDIASKSLEKNIGYLILEDISENGYRSFYKRDL